MKDDLLSKLHTLLAEELTRRLADKENPPTASELNVIRQFLKDNDITSLAEEGSALGDVLQNLPEEFWTRQ